MLWNWAAPALDCEMLFGRSFGQRRVKEGSAAMFHSKRPHSLVLPGEDLEMKARAMTAQTSFSLFQAAPSPSVPTQTASRYPASCQQTRKDTCTQPLPGQAKATAAHQCLAWTGWAPAPHHGQRALPLAQDSALPSPFCLPLTS